MTKTLSILLLLAFAGTSALAAPKKPAAAKQPAAPAASANNAAPVAVSVTPATSEVTLYDGKATGPATLSVADWGGGSGQDSTETYLFGGHSLKVTTLDLYQGARIIFPTPVSLAGDNRVFQMTIRRGGATLHYDPRTTSNVPPGDAPTGFGQAGGGFGQTAAGFGGGGRGGRGGRSGRGGRGGFGGRRNQGQDQNGAQAEAPLIPAVTKVRLHFTFADGRQADTLRPLPDASDAIAGEGWYNVNVPVSALKLGAGPAPLLKSVTVGGDHYGVFFVGRIKLGTDVPTLAISIDGPQTVLPGQPVTLIAKGGSPFSALTYAWDTDAGYGAQDLMSGTEITTRYFEGGQDHTVTLTVTDQDDLKQPMTLTKTIHVSEQGGVPGMPQGGQPGVPRPSGGSPLAGAASN